MTQPATATGSGETCRLVPAQLHRGHRTSVDVRTTHTARGFEVAKAKMVAFGHPNHHTRQPVVDGGTAQCLWHSAVGTRGTAPLSALAGCGTGPRRGRSGRVWRAPALVWAPSMIALLILVIRAARDSVRSREESKPLIFETSCPIYSCNNPGGHIQAIIHDAQGHTPPPLRHPRLGAPFSNSRLRLSRLFSYLCDMSDLWVRTSPRAAPRAGAPAAPFSTFHRAHRIQCRIASRSTSRIVATLVQPT